MKVLNSFHTAMFLLLGCFSSQVSQLSQNLWILAVGYFPLSNMEREANSSPALGSYRTLSSHKLTRTQDFKGALGSRGEKRGLLSLQGPSRDEMELISRRVQQKPRGAAAGGELPTGAKERCKF